jgi:hypothetical protein
MKIRSNKKIKTEQQADPVLLQLLQSILSSVISDNVVQEVLFYSYNFRISSSVFFRAIAFVLNVESSRSTNQETSAALRIAKRRSFAINAYRNARTAGTMLVRPIAL